MGFVTAGRDQIMQFIIGAGSATAGLANTYFNNAQDRAGRGRLLDRRRRRADGPASRDEQAAQGHAGHLSERGHKRAHGAIAIRQRGSELGVGRDRLLQLRHRRHRHDAVPARLRNGDQGHAAPFGR